MTHFPASNDGAKRDIRLIPFTSVRPKLFRCVNISKTQAEFDVALSGNITGYWRAAGGRFVRTRMKEIALHGCPDIKIPVLRSNLRNGLPAKWKVA